MTHAPVVTPDMDTLVEALTVSALILDLSGRFPKTGLGEGYDPDGTARVRVAGRTFRGPTLHEALLSARDGLPTPVEQTALRENAAA